MGTTTDSAMATTKSEMIAAIRRLAPSASEAFLANFSEPQLESFLARLEEVERRYRDITPSRHERRPHNPNC